MVQLRGKIPFADRVMNCQIAHGKMDKKRKHNLVMGTSDKH